MGWLALGGNKNSKNNYCNYKIPQYLHWFFQGFTWMFTLVSTPVGGTKQYNKITIRITSEVAQNPTTSNLLNISVDGVYCIVCAYMKHNTKLN